MTEGAQNLDEIRERYALATTAAKVGVWDWDIKTGDFYLDPNVKGFLGYEDHEIPNDLEIWASYVHPDDKEPVMQAAEDTLEGRQTEYVFEHRMVHKDGSVRWIRVRGAVIRDSDGQPVRFLGTDTDITERKLLEERVSELSSEVQTQIGHDLHDGLAQELAGLTFLLKSLENRLTEEGASHKREFQQLYGVVDDAIGMTRSLALGLSPVLKGGAGLVAALEQLAAHARSLYRVECTVDVAYGIPIGDESRASQLYRIAQEAITNAVQHGKASRIELALRRDGSRLTLSISDNGIGISAPKPDHAGMGLRIMKHRARGLGGSLTVDRRKEGGTLVTCTCAWEV